MGNAHIWFFWLLQRMLHIFIIFQAKKNPLLYFFPILELRDFPRLVKRASRPFSYARIGFPKVQFSFLSLTKFQTSSHNIWGFFCLFQIWLKKKFFFKSDENNIVREEENIEVKWADGVSWIYNSQIIRPNLVQYCITFLVKEITWNQISNKHFAWRAK